MSVVLGRNVLLGGVHIIRHNVCMGSNTSPMMHIAKRTLFHGEVLGVSNYERQRASVQEKIGDLRESFRKRMEDYMETDSKNTIFTDDLKTIVHVAESEDLDTACKMMKRFHQQNDNLRFSTFVFGPLVMRMFHKLNEPQKAMELFSDEDMKGFFSQMSSYVVLMDLMFEHQLYDDVLKMMSQVTEQQLNGFKYPVDCVTLTTAACFKLDTPESLAEAVDLLKKCDAVRAGISLRSILYTALLALMQNNPALAFEVISLSRPSTTGKLPLAFINVKTLVYARLGRIEDAVQMLKAVIAEDTPDHVSAGSEIFQYILDELQKESASETNKEVLRDLEAVQMALKQGNHVNYESFDEYILRPIIRKRRTQDGYKARQRSNRSSQTYQREGLMGRGERM